MDPGVIRLGYVERPGDIASAQVVRAVLEESGFGGELVPLAAGHWAVAKGWTPHWLFAAQDIRFLDDPSGIYGGEEQLVTIVRKGLRASKPDATAVLDNFNWTLADLNRMMLLNRAVGADPVANARQWVLDNMDRVHAWAGR